MLVDKSWLFVVCWCAAMLELLIVARLKVSPVLCRLCGGSVFTPVFMTRRRPKYTREAVWKVSFQDPSEAEREGDSA